MSTETKIDSTEKTKKLEELRRYLAQRSHFSNKAKDLILNALSAGDIPVDKIAALIPEQQQKMDILSRLDTLTRIAAYANSLIPNDKTASFFSGSVSSLLRLLGTDEIKTGKHVDVVLPLLMKGNEIKNVEKRLDELRTEPRRQAGSFR